MGLKEDLKAASITALKSKDKTALDTLRLVLAEFEKKEKSGKAPVVLTEEESVQLLQSEVKKRKGTIEELTENTRSEFEATGSRPARITERIDRENAEIAVLKQFLPEEVSADELGTIVLVAANKLSAENGELSMRDMGTLMKLVKESLGGRLADGRVLSDLVKSAITAA